MSVRLSVSSPLVPFVRLSVLPDLREGHRTNGQTDNAPSRAGELSEIAVTYPSALSRCFRYSRPISVMRNMIFTSPLPPSANSLGAFSRVRVGFRSSRPAMCSSPIAFKTSPGSLSSANSYEPSFANLRRTRFCSAGRKFATRNFRARISSSCLSCLASNCRYFSAAPPGNAMLSKIGRNHGKNPTTSRVTAQASIPRAGSTTCQIRKPAAVADSTTDGTTYDFGHSPLLDTSPK